LHNFDASNNKKKSRVQAVTHLAWKKGVCRGMEAFDHKITFSP